MARASWLALACTLLATAHAPVARAQPRELRVAVYAPWAGPSTADERFAFAVKLETALADAELGPARVSSYAKARDFERALASGKIDIALLDAAAAPSLPKRLVVDASWSSGARWVLAGRTAMASLRNKRLALQAADAASSKRLLARLLRGQLTASYWSLVVSAPVTEDARQLVLRDLADVVTIPERLAGDELVVVASLGSFSELALASSGDARRLVRARNVIRGVVRDTLGGRWTDGPPRFPAEVGPKQPVAARRPPSAPRLLDLLAPVENPLPELPVEELWMEPDAP